MNLSKTEPARLASAGAILIVFVATTFGISLGNFDKDELTGIISSAIVIGGAVIALFERVRALVSSPATAEALAKGTLQGAATPEQREKAAEVLGIDLPSQTIPPELHKAALEVAKYLPAPVSQIVQAVGIPGLELAVKAAQNAMSRAPSPEELNARALGKL